MRVLVCRQCNKAACLGRIFQAERCCAVELPVLALITVEKVVVWLVPHLVTSTYKRKQTGTYRGTQAGSKEGSKQKKKNQTDLVGHEPKDARAPHKIKVRCVACDELCRNWYTTENPPYVRVGMHLKEEFPCSRLPVPAAAPPFIFCMQEFTTLIYIVS